MGANLRVVDSESGVIDRALEIARSRRDTLQRLCNAVLTDDNEAAKKLAKELSGEESDRTNQSFNRIAG